MCSLATAVLVAVLPALSGPPAAAAQEVEEGAVVTITGNVYDAVTSRPIPGVSVEVSSRGLRTETDAAGQFTLSDIPTGAYRLELFHPDYEPAVGDFTIMRSGEFETYLEPVSSGYWDELMTGVAGVVTDARGGAPIDRASVQIRPGGVGGMTDIRGRFATEVLTPGPKQIEVRAFGYAPRTETVDVVLHRVTLLRVSLSPSPVELNPIEVSVERRELALQDIGYYNREAEGFGEFIDRETIEQRAPVQMSDLFRRIVGAEVRSGADGPFQRFVILRGGRSEGCFPRVLLDGIVVHPGGDEAAAIDDLIDPEAVSGIEVYPSSTGVPMQYSGTDASCGVILIWTRR